MNPEPLNERVEAALRQLTGQGARISITAVAALAGIPRSSLYRNAAARDLIHRRIAETRLDSEKNMALEILRLSTLVDALAARVRNQEERLRQLEGRPHSTPR
ncbi:hypothetical protein [Arthrobacter sp. UYEF21]|uniref:hypothetical protein n=1 Tax=Arthrobacter sp. UYEF21 TaxID=1756364 RepID=UPI00339658BB